MSRMLAAAALSEAVDTAALRKARGAFFTPDPISQFVTQWAVRSAADAVLEPSAGDAAFLVQAARRLRHLSGDSVLRPRVAGVEIHAHSARVARARVRDAGGDPEVIVSDFFLVQPRPEYDVVVGNPPYIRYQDFTGEARSRSRAAALQAGVSLTALASSWAAFTIHSALFLRPGGRMGLVLPAELLSVNYAAAVRRFLFERFRSVELVLFTQQVFPEAEADVVLLLADGYDQGPTDHAVIYQAQDADSLATMGRPSTWAPVDPAGKWTSLLVDPDAERPLRSLRDRGLFTDLEAWGDTTLGMVTGNNNYFALSPARVKELGLRRTDLVRLSPPGSAHLRGLELTSADLVRLGRQGRSTWLFRPPSAPSPHVADLFSHGRTHTRTEGTGGLSASAATYIEAGHVAGVDQAYKCRVRTPWYRVPLLPPADLLLTCMNADTPRLTTNTAAAHHLNSVHGVYLRDDVTDLGRELLPLASVNSLTLLHAEIVGRSYGGGILKLEPREADGWAMPSPNLVRRRARQLRAVRAEVADLLGAGSLYQAAQTVDRALLGRQVSATDLQIVRRAREAMTRRRLTRGKSGR